MVRRSFAARGQLRDLERATIRGRNGAVPQLGMVEVALAGLRSEHWRWCTNAEHGVLGVIVVDGGRGRRDHRRAAVLVVGGDQQALVPAGAVGEASDWSIEPIGTCPSERVAPASRRLSP